MRIVFIGDSLTAGRPGASYFKILQRALRADELINMGHANETVVSLLKRIRRTQFTGRIDLAFLWIGVNDVVGDRFSALDWVARLMRIRPAEDLGEFKDCYSEILDILTEKARKVILVPPGLKGEHLGNQFNRQLEAISNLIRKQTDAYENAGFLDLRAAFSRSLEGHFSSNYLPETPLTVALDLLWSSQDGYIDRKSAERGLVLTLDVIHLNNAGARLVAEAFLQVISG